MPTLPPALPAILGDPTPGPHPGPGPLPGVAIIGGGAVTITAGSKSVDKTRTS